MGRYLTLLILLTAIFGCRPTAEQKAPSPQAVDAVLDDWHNAASEADFERYFDHFTSDSAVFMGTDSSERWTVAEFKPWSKPYFDNGETWNFTPVERHINFSDNGQTAWFDESLDTPNLGPARGSGVLVNSGEGWKIAHYNLSIPIPNNIVRDVVEQIDDVQNSSADD